MKRFRLFGVPIVAVALGTSAAFAQPQQSPAVADVRQMVTDAAAEIASYQPSPDAEHPAIKWDRQLWSVHERGPQSEAGALAAVEAVRLLTRARLWERADARAASLDVDDRAWERLSSVIYEAGITRNDLPRVVATLSPIAASTSSPSIRAAALMVIARVHRRQADLGAAAQALRDAGAAAPNTAYADEADGLLYEVEHLSPGLPAPPVSGKPRKGRALNMAALRGKPVVLVFWGTT